MTREDKEFLRELQHELKTQDNDGQAAPRFWGVAEIKRFPTSSDYGDEEVIYDSNACCEVEIEEIVERMEECWDEVEHDIYDKDDIRFMEPDRLVEFAEEEFGWDNYELCYYLEEQVVSTQTGCFLTKRACQKHIDLNSYHYNQGHTFAMTAWRNPEFERLLKILTEMNLDEIKED